ncbi:MAG: hypothetical protein FWD92_01230 [Methanomassiliicoccaceae archaeon]|nr:hypothetical protein [Methanomassiliicoccaceae archaeon]
MNDLYRFTEEIPDIEYPRKVTDTYSIGEGIGKGIHTRIEVPFENTVRCPAAERNAKCTIASGTERVGMPGHVSIKAVFSVRNKYVT